MKRSRSINHLAVRLRCALCKQLFTWKPKYYANIQDRLPDVCSDRCRARLRDWTRYRELKAG